MILFVYAISVNPKILNDLLIAWIYEGFVERPPKVVYLLVLREDYIYIYGDCTGVVFSSFLLRVRLRCGGCVAGLGERHERLSSGRGSRRVWGPRPPKGSGFRAVDSHQVQIQKRGVDSKFIDSFLQCVLVRVGVIKVGRIWEIRNIKITSDSPCPDGRSLSQKCNTMRAMQHFEPHNPLP